MKTLTKKNFIKFLVERGACKRGLTWAKKQRRAKDIIEKCTNNDHLYWLIWAIGGPLWTEYREKVAPFWVKYLEKGTPFWAEYEEKRYNLAKEICTFERVQEAIGS